MRPDDLFRIRHMIEAGEAALRFAEGRRRSDLDADLQLQFALVRAVEIIGEAASKVSAAARAAAPGVPWPQIVATRNRLIHAYFDIDRDVLWTTVEGEIPELLRLLKALSKPA